MRDFLGVVDRPVCQAEIWLELARLTTDSAAAADCRQLARDIYVRIHAECHLLNVELEELSLRSAQKMDNVPILLRVTRTVASFTITSARSELYRLPVQSL